MAGVNKVIIMGRLGQTPELKTIQSGDCVTTLSIATSKKWKNKQGQDQEKTEWHRVIAWRKAAETICKFLQKGDMIYVEGELQTRTWEENGAKRYATEILCTSFQFCGNSGGGGQRPSGPPTPGTAPDFGYGGGFDANDEIPF